MKILPSKTVNTFAKPMKKAVKSLYEDGLCEIIGKQVGKLATKRPFEAAVDFLERLETTGMGKLKVESTAAIMQMSSWSITVFSLQNIAKSKKIEPERKPFLLIDTGLMTVISTILGIKIDNWAKKVIPRFEESYKKNFPEISGEELAKKMKGVRKMKSQVVFASVVRFSIPILMVPVIGAIVKQFNIKKEAKARAILAQEQEDKRIQTEGQPKPLDIKNA